MDSESNFFTAASRGIILDVTFWESKVAEGKYPGISKRDGNFPGGCSGNDGGSCMGTGNGSGKG